MGSFVAAVLADPKILLAILSAFGGAIGWLWKLAHKSARAHRQCEIDLARLKVLRHGDRGEIDRLNGSVDTLIKLVKKEIDLG